MKKIISIIAAAGIVAAGGRDHHGVGDGDPQPSPVVATAAPPSAAAAPSEPTATTFQPISLKGKGKNVAKFTIPEGAAAIADITHKGEKNFIVHSIDASGETIDGLVNVIGNYGGTVLFDTNTDDHSVAFAIDADGAWTITIKPVISAKCLDPMTPLAGLATTSTSSCRRRAGL